MSMFASRDIRLLVLSSVCAGVAAAGACVEADPGSSDELGTIEAIPAPQAQTLAQELSRVVGATIRPQDVTVLPARRFWGIPNFSPLLDNKNGKWVFAEVATPATANSFTAVVAAPSSWSQSVVGATAAIVVSSAAIRTCPTAVCALGGCITGMVTVPDGQGCPPLQCTSSADCADSPAPDCMFNTCEDGQCMANNGESGGGPCPPSDCMTSFDCSGGTKDCSYKVCDDGECTSVSVTIPNQDPCPFDECTSDDMCSLGDDGGIFEDIGY